MSFSRKVRMMFVTPKRHSPRAHAQNTLTSTTYTRRPYARTHLRSRYTTGPAIRGHHLRREGLGGCVGQRLRHVACPAGTGRHPMGRERLSPEHPARTHKHHQQHVAPAQKEPRSPKKVALWNDSLRVSELSHEATTALSHEVTDASPEGVGVLWPGSG